MLYSYFTEKLTGLQGVLIKNVENNDDFITISLEMKLTRHKCPFCGAEANQIAKNKNGLTYVKPSDCRQNKMNTVAKRS